MKPWLLFAFCLLGKLSAHGQVAAYTLAGAQAAAATDAQVNSAVNNYLAANPNATPAPSSVRYCHPAAWFTDANPGVEGAFGVPTDDTNHMFVYHLNHWRCTLLTTPQTP